MVSGAGDSERKLGRFHLIEPIGGGPTGESFRAKVYGVAGFERQFAVKRFHRELVKHKPAAEAIARAARVYGNLEHPRIARMQEFGVAGGETFAATELVDGIDAARLLSATHGCGAPPPVAAIMVLVLQAARAIGYAHGRSVAHLGVCPTNIVCRVDGELKVTDFGFLPPRLPSKPADDFTLLARLPYLAPEQLLREETSAATDVFQLGVLAYELLTGERPFRGPTPLEIAHAILSANPPPPNAPAPIVRVLSRALARSPFERYPDASALGDGIEAAMRESSLVSGARELVTCVRGAVASLRSIEAQASSGAFAFPMPAPPIRVAETPLARAIERGAVAPDGPLAVAAPPRRTVLGMAPPAPRGEPPTAAVPPPIPRAARASRRFSEPPPRSAASPPRGRGIPATGAHAIDDDAPTNVLPSGVGAAGALGVGIGLMGTEAFPVEPTPVEAIADALAEELASIDPPTGDDGLELDDFPPTPLPPSLPDIDEPTGAPAAAMAPPPPASLPPIGDAPPRGPVADDRTVAADVPFADVPLAEAAVARRISRRAVIAGAAAVFIAAGAAAWGLGLGTHEVAAERRPPGFGARPEPRAARPSAPPPSARSGAAAAAPEAVAANAVESSPHATPANAARPESSGPAAAPAEPAAAREPSEPGGPSAAPGEPGAAPGEPAAAREPGGPVATQPPPAPPPEVAPLGKLVISTRPPGARLYLDGTLVGKAPQTLDSTNDRHRLAVVLSGYRLHTADIDGDGELAIDLVEVTPPAGQGGIKVRCRDKNRYYVILDGQDTGQLCPTERLGAKLGLHALEIYDPVTDARHSFSVEVDQTRLSKRVRVD